MVCKGEDSIRQSEKDKIHIHNIKTGGGRDKLHSQLCFWRAPPLMCRSNASVAARPRALTGDALPLTRQTGLLPFYSMQDLFVCSSTWNHLLTHAAVAPSSNHSARFSRLFDVALGSENNRWVASTPQALVQRGSQLAGDQTRRCGEGEEWTMDAWAIILI